MLFKVKISLGKLYRLLTIWPENRRTHIDIRQTAWVFNEKTFVDEVFNDEHKPHMELPNDMKDNYHFGEL